jgi:hypothetical protein
LGLTIWDRLFRAAEGQVFDLETGVDAAQVLRFIQQRKVE